ncbi:major facilitator superfamily domain-containing protein [Lactifluus volemus]|nr:major facilitator superfamily domain-containing protein [Lactifluus volemus]
MSHLPHCPSSLALCGDGAHHESLVSDGKFEAGLLSPPVSSAAVSAVHLHEATFPTQTQTLTSFVGEETAKDRTDLSSSQPLTTVRVLMIHIGAALTLFLATTDATIVSTCLPTIIQTLDGSQAEFTWIGVAYLLSQTACQPLYGRLSDLLGRKSVLFSSIVLFGLGSLLCGAARDLQWLIAARALSGVGGGGIVSSVWVITTEIVEVPKRAKWSQVLSITWSCSALAGPVLGGVFSSSSFLSWRWAFYLNVPICCMGALVLALSLNGIELAASEGASWEDFLHKFDFVGLLLFIGSTSCIIVGLSLASSRGWTAPLTLILITMGPSLLISAGVYELWTTRNALFPRAIFNNVNIIILLIVSFLQNVAFNSGTFYLTLYYQTVNVPISTLHAGVMLLPYSLGSSLASIPATWLIGAIQRRTHNTVGQKWVISSGLLIATTGFALLCLLGEHTRTIMQSFLPLLGGFGLGMLNHAPYQSLTSALPPKELAAGTGAFFLVRFTGATVGLARLCIDVYLL